MSIVKQCMEFLLITSVKYLYLFFIQIVPLCVAVYQKGSQEFILSMFLLICLTISWLH